MNDLPLHPLLVHLPLGLAAVVPLVILGVAGYSLFARFLTGAWSVVVFLQLVLAVGTFVSMEAGEDEEDRVRPYVPHAALEAHEESGENLLYFAIGTWVLCLIPLVRKDEKTRKIAAAAAFAGSLATLGVAVQAGRLGATLVYQYDAPEAYEISDPEDPSDTLH